MNGKKKLSKERRDEGINESEEKAKEGKKR